MMTQDQQQRALAAALDRCVCVFSRATCVVCGAAGLSWPLTGGLSAASISSSSAVGQQVSSTGKHSGTDRHWNDHTSSAQLVDSLQQLKQVINSRPPCHSINQSIVVCFHRGICNVFNAGGLFCCLYYALFHWFFFNSKSSFPPTSLSSVFL